MADLALEETNRIRASLGMKPLPAPGSNGLNFSEKSNKRRKTEDTRSSSEESSDEEHEEPGSTLESRQAQAYDNWQNIQNEASAKKARDAKAEAIKKARAAAQRFSKLEGKTLAEENDGGEGADLDTRTWLLQQKKRRKRLEKEREKAERLERELAEREQAMLEQQGPDLSGVHVAHAVEDFEGSGEQILTLKDATIDQNEEDGDELENMDIKEQDALNERLNSKKKKPVYDPHADGMEGSRILNQYDEAIDGKKKKRFQLEGQGISAEDREALKQAVGDRLKAQPISLDLLKDEQPNSDYAAPVEAKIKKQKKKKHSSRKRPVDEDDIFPQDGVAGPSTNGDSMALDRPDTVINGAKPSADNFADDEDLQASLAIQRQAALRKRKRTKPKDLARRLREEGATPANGTDDDNESEGGLVIDETSEFVASLHRAKNEEDERPKVKKARSNTPIKPEEQDALQEPALGDIDMEGEANDDEGYAESQFKREASTPGVGLTETGLEEEATIQQGIGATLSMLTQRGLVKSKEDDSDIVALQRDRQQFLMDKRRREAEVDRRAKSQRERDRASGRLDHMSARDREEYARQENRQRDQMESRVITEVFNKEYKPNVELKYIDEHGRHMNQKEAFKHLSHQFHGKGSGKQKTEKHLKRIDDDKRREAQSLLDSSQATGMNNAAGATAKKNRQAGVRLA